MAADEPSPCGCPQQIQLTIKGWLCGLLCQQGKVLGAQRIPKRAVQMGLLSDRKSTPPCLTPQGGTSLPFLSSAGLQQPLLVCSNERTSHGTYESILNLRSPVHVNRTLKGHFGLKLNQNLGIIKKEKKKQTVISLTFMVLFILWNILGANTHPGKAKTDSSYIHPASSLVSRKFAKERDKASA